MHWIDPIRKVTAGKVGGAERGQSQLGSSDQRILTQLIKWTDTLEKSIPNPFIIAPWCIRRWFIDLRLYTDVHAINQIDWLGTILVTQPSQYIITDTTLATYNMCKRVSQTPHLSDILGIKVVWGMSGSLTCLEVRYSPVISFQDISQIKTCLNCKPWSFNSSICCCWRRRFFSDPFKVASLLMDCLVGKKTLVGHELRDSKENVKRHS